MVERYVRLDPAGATQGNGPGLSLVDAIARQHGAGLVREDNKPGLRAVMRFRVEPWVRPAQAIRDTG